MMQETVDPEIGDERSRVKDATVRPHSGVAHLKYETGESKGTGFLVTHDDKTFLVTAAHCLWDSNNSAITDEVLICLGENGHECPFQAFKKTKVHFRVPSEYKETREPLYDYGIILLDWPETPGLDRCYAFGIREQRESIKQSSLYMSGYPGSDCTQSTIALKTAIATDQQILHRDATTPGNSGSPVYEMENGRYVARAVHIHGFEVNDEYQSNEAVRIDVEALMKLVENENTSVPGMAGGIWRPKQPLERLKEFSTFGLRRLCQLLCCRCCCRNDGNCCQ